MRVTPPEFTNALASLVALQGLALRLLWSDPANASRILTAAADMAERAGLFELAEKSLRPAAARCLSRD